MTNFTDHCYSHAFVARVNDELASDKTAIQMWEAVKKHLWDLEGQNWLDTEPREFLLLIMDERRIRGFDRLAKRFGYVVKGKNAIQIFRDSFIEVCPHTGRRFNIATGEVLSPDGEVLVHAIDP